MKNTIKPVTRRQALKMACVAGGVAVAGGVRAYGGARPQTAEQVMGPFYPVIKPLDRDADLTVVEGRHGSAMGQVVYLMGRVVDRHGKPVVNAHIEIWQANVFGRYDHPSDPNTGAALDPNFQGYAKQYTDDLGRYRFKTIKPGAYPATPQWIRTPHIHFDVTGHNDRLVTQLYFEGEALNATDEIFQSLGSDQQGVLVELVPSPQIEPGSLLGQWDIVLNNG
jgi:protocatechuate 3,4-dioxygenase beta subunit